MKLNEKIFALRKRYGYSQEELAYKLGVSRQTVSKWETNSMNPETEKIIMMSKLFNVTTDMLLIDDIEIPLSKENNVEPEKERIPTIIPVSKKKRKDNLLSGIILMAVSLIGIICIILISTLSSAAGDVTVFYSTMYISLKTLLFIFILIFVIGTVIIAYKLIVRKRKKGKDKE